MVEISLADELRFLAAQCAAHAEGSHRDQDRQFVAGLVMQLTVLGGKDAGNVASLLEDEAARSPLDDLPDLIRLSGTALRHGARMIERRQGSEVAA